MQGAWKLLMLSLRDDVRYHFCRRATRFFGRYRDIRDDSSRAHPAVAGARPPALRGRVSRPQIAIEEPLNDTWTALVVPPIFTIEAAGACSARTRCFRVREIL